MADGQALPADIETSFAIAERTAKSVAAVNQRTLDSVLDWQEVQLGILEGHALSTLGRAAALAAVNDPL